MIEAVLYSIFTVLAFFGVLKLFELVQAFALVKGKEKAVLVCKIKNNIESAEMTVRALATDVSNTVFVISDNLDLQTEELCRKTAEQYNNVAVGKIEDLKYFIAT